jgi:hypothetical protein
MDTLQRTLEVLGETETKLAALAGDAAKEASYDTAACLIDLAKDVADLASKARAQLESEAKSLGQPVESSQSTAAVTNITTQSQIKGRPKRTEYPKFLREGNNLVKLGWSPSEKSEYEHKSPREVIPLLVTAVSKIGSNGRRFSMNKILPLVNPTNNSHVPDYQVYLCLAWLRTLGLLTQHGRQGYSLTTKAPIEPLIDTRWTALPAR